jgi:effector-binding domain-containing protein
MLTPALIVITALAVIAVMVWQIFIRRPGTSEFLFLTNPRIVVESDTMVLEVAGQGAPEIVAKQGFSILFKTYFKLKGVPKGPRMPIPRGRWRFDSSEPPVMYGRIAIPVPETTAGLSPFDPPQGITVKLVRWEYGEVAEILHIGPYEQEKPTVEHLKTFIAEHGYEIIDDHEEQYLRGPGMFGKGNPAKYQTIIRFRVRKHSL